MPTIIYHPELKPSHQINPLDKHMTAIASLYKTKQIISTMNATQQAHIEAHRLGAKLIRSDRQREERRGKRK